MPVLLGTAYIEKDRKKWEYTRLSFNTMNNSVTFPKAVSGGESMYLKEG